MDELETQVPPTYFGIKSCSDKAGSVKWTISIVLDVAEPHPRSAHLDEISGTWILDPLEEHNAESSSDLQPARKESLDRSNEAWWDALPPSDHNDLFRNLDWSVTPLGSCATWPHALRLYTQMLFSDSRAAAIYWGPQRIAIYNESAAPVIGNLHPKLMGSAFEEIMPHLWGFYGPLFHALENGQEGYSQNELEIPFRRDGFLEETWWNGGLISLKDDGGNHGGVYFSWTEVTRSVLQNRRMALAKGLGLSPLPTIDSTWQHIHDILAQYPRDIPMAIMYGTDENDLRNGTLRLRHTIGITGEYVGAPSRFDVRHRNIFLRLLRNTANSRFVLAPNGRRTLPISFPLQTCA